MINVPLLRKELEHITAHRDEWDQGTWLRTTLTTACGTTGCLAGNTALHTGWQPATVNGVVNLDAVPLLMELTHVARGSTITTVRDAAQVELGLTGWQANMLFSGQNSLLRLWVVAHVLTEGEVEIPESVVSDVSARHSNRPLQDLIAYESQLVAETRTYYDELAAEIGTLRLGTIDE
jgi:hypothetical protein